MSVPATSIIAKQACLLMEVAPISSFGDGSELAVSMGDIYPVVVQGALEAADWDFASVLAWLPAAVPGATDAADPDLPYLYQPPGDLVKLREVGDADTKWRLDRGWLRASDGAPLRARYTATCDTEARMPAEFRLAVALRLAALLGPRYLGTQSKTADLRAQAESALKSAMRACARSASDERYDGLPDPGDWVAEALR